MTPPLNARPFGLCLALALYCTAHLPAQAPKLRTNLKCPSGPLCLAFSPDGKALAVGLGDGTTRLWELSSGKLSATLAGTKWPVTALAFDRDGKTLATGTVQAVAGKQDGNLFLWDVKARKRTRTLLKVAGGGGAVSHVFSLAFHKDGKTLAAGSSGAVLVWDVTKDKRALVLIADGFEEEFNGAAITPDGKAVVAGHSGMFGSPAVVVWGLPGGKTSKAFKDLKGKPTALALSPDGKAVAVPGPEGISAILLPLGGGKAAELEGTKGATTSALAFSPDGKLLAAGAGGEGAWDKKCDVELWDVAGRKKLATLTGHKGAVRSVAFSRDGALLASAGEDGVVRLWELGPAKKPR